MKYRILFIRKGANHMHIHEKILALLDTRGVKYRVVEHAPEGRSEAIARIRGNQSEQALKAIVTIVKRDKKTRDCYLAILPGNKRLDLDALAAYGAGKKAIFAPRETAMEITGCKIGAIPPFSFNESLRVVVDPSIRENEEIVFNAGLLTKSVFMACADYIDIVQPALASIASAVDGKEG